MHTLMIKGGFFVCNVRERMDLESAPEANEIAKINRLLCQILKADIANIN